jgi:hypothetical protein
MEQTIDRGRAGAIPAGAGVLRGLRWVAGITVLLVLIQAVLIGQGLFANPDLTARHGEVANLTFLATLALVALALVAWRRGALGIPPLVASVALVVLVTAQIGLGYAGRESAGAASWHVPMGVLIFGLAVALFGLVGGWGRTTPAT